MRRFYPLLRLQLLGAWLLGDHLRVLLLEREIVMIDITKLSASVARIVAKVQADEAELAATKQQLADLESNIQPQIDALTAQIDQVVPETPPA